MNNVSVCASDIATNPDLQLVNIGREIGNDDFVRRLGSRGSCGDLATVRDGSCTGPCGGAIRVPKNLSLCGLTAGGWPASLGAGSDDLGHEVNKVVFAGNRGGVR